MSMFSGRWKLWSENDDSGGRMGQMKGTIRWKWTGMTVEMNAL